MTLTEQVRSALRRAISHRAARGSDTLVVYLLDNQIEDTVRSSIQHNASGSFLALEPEITPRRSWRRCAKSLAQEDRRASDRFAHGARHPAVCA